MPVELPRRRSARSHLRVVSDNSRRLPLPDHVPPLTRREALVLSHLEVDLTLEEVAKSLYVSRNTVKSQVRTLYKKIGVSTRHEAVAFAARYGYRTN